MKSEKIEIKDAVQDKKKYNKKNKKIALLQFFTFSRWNGLLCINA